MACAADMWLDVGVLEDMCVREQLFHSFSNNGDVKLTGWNVSLEMFLASKLVTAIMTPQHGCEEYSSLKESGGSTLKYHIR